MPDASQTEAERAATAPDSAAAPAAAGPQGRFTRGPIMRHVAVMTLSGAVGLTLMFLVDGATLFYIALLGDETLTAAVGYAWTIQFFIVSLGLAASIAATATVSRAIGARDRAGARRAATSALMMTVLALGALSTVTVIFRDAILYGLGARGATLEAASSFFAWSAPSMALMGAAMVAGAILRAEGDAARSMAVTASSAATSLILDPLLIFHTILGAPIGAGWGIEGAAIAMVGARCVSCAVGMHGVARVHDLAARPSLAGMRRDAGPILAVAGPATLTQMSTPFGNWLITEAVAEHGDGAMAGWTVTTRLSVLAFGGIFALSASVGGIFGQNYGAGRMQRVRRAYRDGLLFCAIYVSIAWALLALTTEVAISGFNLPPDGAAVLRAFSYLGAGGFIFAGGVFVVNAAFNTLGRPIYSSGVNWARDGLFTFLWLALLTGTFGAKGGVWAQGLAALSVGLFAMPLGWLFVSGLRPPWRPGRLRRRARR